MREATVRVEREQRVDAAPEKVWELAGSPVALSACPGWFAFAVPGAVAGTSRLCCLLVSGQGGSFDHPFVDIGRVRTMVVDAREEIPGQQVSWQVLSTEPAGKQVFTVSVRRRPGGSAVGIAVSDVVPRGVKGERRSYWRGQVRAWLGCLRAAAEGRAPWPRAEMPAAVQQAMAETPPLRTLMEASGAVVIDAAPGAVWEAVWDPASEHLRDPERTAWSGHVPGTPARDVGEMQYFVSRRPGGRFTVSVCMVTELADGHRAVIRHLGRPHEVVHVVTSVPGGTRLELTDRWLGRVRRDRPGSVELRERGSAEMQQHAEGCKALIEGPRTPAAEPPAAEAL